MTYTKKKIVGEDKVIRDIDPDNPPVTDFSRFVPGEPIMAKRNAEHAAKHKAWLATQKAKEKPED